MRAEVFLDTSYAIALSSIKDNHHKSALLLAEQLQSENTRLVTTRAILLEIGNALSKQNFRRNSVGLLSSLENDSTVEIVSITEVLYFKGFNLYKEREDKNWGLVDCISFIVMKEREIIEALTADEHFIQAGYQALLKQAI